MEATNVLVVDESTLIVRLIVKLLLQNNIRGHHFNEDHIFVAHDGMEAFDMIGNYPEISLIISEVNIPSLNGDELVEILIDTDRISGMDVVLITGKERALQLGSSTKKNILGVIQKPFNKDTFPATFNRLLEEKQKTLEDQVLIQKENQAKQELSLDVLHSYLERTKQSVNEEVLVASLQEQFSFDTRVLDEDLLTLINLALEEYYALNEVEDAIDTNVLLNCYKQKQHPTKVYSNVDPFKLRQGFENVLNQVNHRVEALKEIDTEKTLAMMFKEIEDKCSIILSRVKHYPKLTQELYEPYFGFIIDALSLQDPDVNDYALQEMLAQYKELMAFHTWLKSFYQKMEIYAKIPKLKSSKELVDECNKKLHTVFRYASVSILHYTGAIEKKIWSQAKASATIMRFFRKHMPNTIPNTKNMLIYLKKIQKNDIKNFEALEHENVVIISNHLATLQEVKNKQEENFPLWQMFGFSKATLLEAWLESNDATKIILDYDFTTPVFQNGLQYLFYLEKKFPEIKKLFKSETLFILASKAKVIDITEHKKDLEFVLIPKPLKSSEITNTLMYS